MEELFSVVYAGKLKAGVTSEEVTARLMEASGLSEARAQALIADGSPRTLKKNLDESSAKRYREALERMGMIVQIKPMLPKTETLELVPMEEAANDKAHVSAHSASDFNRYPSVLRPPSRRGGKGDGAGQGQDVMPENPGDDSLPPA